MAIAIQNKMNTLLLKNFTTAAVIANVMLRRAKNKSIVPIIVTPNNLFFSILLPFPSIIPLPFQNGERFNE
jgi:hypothetical protein